MKSYLRGRTFDVAGCRFSVAIAAPATFPVVPACFHRSSDGSAALSELALWRRSLDRRIDIGLTSAEQIITTW